MKKVLVFCLFILGSVGALANQISGSITIKGGITLNSSIATATQVSSWNSANVESVSGDFSLFLAPSDAVNITAPFVFSPSTSYPVLYYIGGFTFELLSSEIVFQNDSFLLLSSKGKFIGNGFDETEGLLNVSIPGPSAQGIYTFSAGTKAEPVYVLDAGSPFSLLLGGFAGIILIPRRKI